MLRNAYKIKCYNETQTARSTRKAKNYSNPLSSNKKSNYSA